MEKTNKTLIILIVVLIVLGALLLALMFGSKKYSSPANFNQVISPTPITKTISPKNDKSTRNAQVLITKAGFSPSTISIIRGSQITFINTDTAPHSLASGKNTPIVGFELDQPLNYNDTFAFTFENQGTFTYLDPLNPGKYIGTIIVQ